MLTILVRETGFDYFTFALRHSGDAFSVLSCGRPTREPLRRAFCNPAECARPDRLAVHFAANVTQDLRPGLFSGAPPGLGSSARQSTVCVLAQTGR